MAMQDKVIEAAEKWLGYLEKKSNASLDSLTANAGSNNYTIFAKQYADRWGENYQAQPWCAVFVSDMLYEGCGKEIVPHFAYCPYGVQGFKERGQWVTSNPQRGDVIFFRDSQGVACHVGLVSSVSKDTVVTIEGNTSGAAGVIANGGCVRKKSYSLSYSHILGYGRPAYEEVVETMTKEEIQAIVQAIAQTTAQSTAQAAIQAAIPAITQTLRTTLDKEMIQVYERKNPSYTSFEQVPSWWQEEVRGMLACGAIQGDGVHEMNIRYDALQAMVIIYRAMCQQQQPERVEPEETSSEAPKREEIKSEETKPGETKPEETKPEETKPEETKPEETKPETSVSEEPA